MFPSSTRFFKDSKSSASDNISNKILKIPPRNFCSISAVLPAAWWECNTYRVRGKMRLSSWHLESFHSYRLISLDSFRSKVTEKIILRDCLPRPTVFSLISYTALTLTTRIARAKQLPFSSTSTWCSIEPGRWIYCKINPISLSGLSHEGILSIALWSLVPAQN